MKRKITIVFGVIAVITGVGVVIAELAHDEGQERFPRPKTRQVTHFAVGQEERVLQLLKEDLNRRELTNDSPYTTPKVVPWISATGEQLIGGVATLELGRAISTGPANWPYVILPTAAVPNPLPGKRYLQRTVRLSATGVTEITAFVDLEKGVVGLEPGGPNSKVKMIKAYGTPPGKAYRRPRGY